MVDATGWIFGSVFALIGVLSLIYSFSYMKKYANLAEYYGVFVMMILCLVGLSFSRNLLLIYMFWELIA
ncbi:proton-conducting membrane transporter, partial [Candidatus Desantisbacteria bacterium CG_4_9_14_3_um_filter_50_7]